MIPKIIHQTAPADKSKWHPIWEICQNSWKENFPSPEYSYKFWNDDDLYNYYNGLKKISLREQLDLTLGFTHTMKS